MNHILFSYDHGDLQVYQNLERLVSKIEKIDVLNGEYLFWDDGMREYTINISKWPKIWQHPSPDILVQSYDGIGENRIYEIMLDYCRRFQIHEGDGQAKTLARAILEFQQKC